MMNTDTPNAPPDTAEPAQPNLMVLKGVVVGLGVLLLLGMILIAIKISTGVSDEPKAVAPLVALDILPPLPMRQGERVHSVSANGYRIFVVLEHISDGGERRVLYTDSAAPAGWRELATITAP
ncbi:MAG: hypothetical protein AAF986_03955 [Pseudomonadota bacterium]